MRKRIAVISTVIALSITASAVAAGVHYPDFSSTQGLTLNGDARKAGKKLRLVDGQSQAGSAFLKEKTVQTADSFESKFLIRPRFANILPGDGMAFVVTGADSDALGLGGGGIGYSGITPSLVVEIDLFHNGEANDPGENHIAVMQNGDHTAHLDYNAPSFDMVDETFYVWVNYNAKKTRVSVRAARRDKKPSEPLFNAPFDLAAVIGTRKARAGFTAGTGSTAIKADVLSWRLK